MKKKIISLLVGLSLCTSLIAPSFATNNFGGVVPNSDILHYNKVVILDTLEVGSERIVKRWDRTATGYGGKTKITLDSSYSVTTKFDIISIITGIVSKSVIASVGKGLFVLEATGSVGITREIELNFPSPKHIAYVVAKERYNVYKIEQINVTDYGSTKKEVSQGIAKMRDPQHVYITVDYQL